MMKVPITVIIPTRDRADTLKHCLRSVLCENYKNLKVIVSDNASIDDTADIVSSINDDRLSYVNTGERVSMTENWEFALGHVQAGWVTILGDDDALIAGALEKVNRIIKETKVQAIRSNGCGYQWPTITENTFGRLSYNYHGHSYKLMESSVALTEVLQGKRHYNTLPVLYNGGFIDIKLLKKAKKESGSFFKSITPDVYSGILISVLTEKYVYSYEPLAINGASHHSGGTAGFERKKRVRAYNPAEKFWQENTISFHPDLPLSTKGRPPKSIHILVLEALLQVHTVLPSKIKKPCYRNQLSIILNDSGPGAKDIEEWGERFALLHDINFQNAVKQSKGFGIRKNLYFRRFKSIIEILSMIHIHGKVDLPLSNVYEASQTISNMRLTRIDWLRGLVNVALRKLNLRYVQG